MDAPVMLARGYFLGSSEYANEEWARPEASRDVQDAQRYAYAAFQQILGQMTGTATQDKAA